MTFKMTKRRREVLYHVAFGGMHGTSFRLQRVNIPSHGAVDRWTMAGVDVTEIVNKLARAKLIRLWYNAVIYTATGYAMQSAQRCLCVTAKGIEELLWPHL